MNRRHQRPRRPGNRDNRFNWVRIRIHHTAAIEWRLFRRDERGAWHMAWVTAYPHESRAEIARRLAAARRKLLVYVDNLDLLALGVLSEVAS